jgi:hypothetical protein
MPNSDLSTDADADDETPDDIVIHPEDSASRQQLPFDPELLSPSFGGSALTNAISAVFWHSTKNATLHLRCVHKLGPDGDLQPPGIRQQRLREPFGNTTPRISFNPEVSKANLLRWMAICNIPFNAAENTSVRLLAGYQSACVRSCSSPSRMYTRLWYRLPLGDETIQAIEWTHEEIY